MHSCNQMVHSYFARYSRNRKISAKNARYLPFLSDICLYLPKSHNWGGRGRKFKSCHSDQKAFEFCVKCTDSEAFLYQKRPLFVTFTQSDRFCFEVWILPRLSSTNFLRIYSGILSKRAPKGVGMRIFFGIFLWFWAGKFSSRFCLPLLPIRKLVSAHGVCSVGLHPVGIYYSEIVGFWILAT